MFEDKGGSGYTLKSVDDYRDTEVWRKLARKIENVVTKPWTIMELCGGQTHTVLQCELDYLLKDLVNIVHGPGCPVCLTPAEFLDNAFSVASCDGVIFCTFHEFLRVRGSSQDLLDVKAAGGDVRVVYSPLDCLAIAAANPDARVIFFGIGFETSAHANAMSVWQARRMGLKNYFLLTSQLLVSSIIPLVAQMPEASANAFLVPGDIGSVVGTREFESMSKQLKVPIVIAGPDAQDLLESILLAVEQLESGEAEAEIQFPHATRSGNTEAQALVRELFELTDSPWRALGRVHRGSLKLRPGFAQYDCEKAFNLKLDLEQKESSCIAAQILSGGKKPPDCPFFATSCTPENPAGAIMSSLDGTCAAYFRHRRSR